MVSHLVLGNNNCASDFGVYTTGGGDNFVIAQQTGHYLVKSLNSVRKGNRVPPVSEARILTLF